MTESKIQRQERLSRPMHASGLDGRYEHILIIHSTPRWWQAPFTCEGFPPFSPSLPFTSWSEARTERSRDSRPRHLSPPAPKKSLPQCQGRAAVGFLTKGLRSGTESVNKNKELKKKKKIPERGCM